MLKIFYEFRLVGALINCTSQTISIQKVHSTNLSQVYEAFLCNRQPPDAYSKSNKKHHSKVQAHEEFQMKNSKHQRDLKSKTWVTCHFQNMKRQRTSDNSKPQKARAHSTIRQTSKCGFKINIKINCQISNAQRKSKPRQKKLVIFEDSKDEICSHQSAKITREQKPAPKSNQESHSIAKISRPASKRQNKNL
ncbi:hypothetical protein Droror1_Dr00025883 [Drosera rotundifolia]